MEKWLSQQCFVKMQAGEPVDTSLRNKSGGPEDINCGMLGFPPTRGLSWVAGLLWLPDICS